MDNSIIKKLELFFSQYKLIRYKKKDVIMRPDDSPQGVYFLKKGYVKFYSISQEGGELTLNIFKPGSYFSMLWAMGDIANIYIFEAMTDVEVLRAPKKDLMDFLKSEPEVLLELTKRVFVGLNGLLVRIEYLLFGDAYNKVASVLLMSAKRFGVKNNGSDITIDLPLTHQEVANLASLTRETTSIQMKKLEKNNFIYYSGRKIVIKNIGKLKEESLIYQEEVPLPYTF